MNEKILALAGQFLDDAAEVLGRKGCNDWEFPESWTVEERRLFVRRFHDWNGDPEEFNPDHLYLPDFAVAGFLAAILKGEATV